MAMLLASVVAALVMPSHSQIQPPDSDILSRDSTKKYAVQGSWNDFKDKYNYHPDDVAEEKKRLDIFTANIDTINDVNSQNLDYSLDVNQFAHLSPEEFQSQYLGYRKPEKLWGDTPSLGIHSYSGKPLADSVDWVQKKAVTGIKNQGKCGSCWAFSTTGALEGARAIATGELISLSEQQFLDCDVKSGDFACKGGHMHSAFQFAKEHAICTERSYPYVNINGTCKASTCSVGIPKGGILGARYVASGDLQGLMEAVMQQPVSVSIAASSIGFQLYKEGIWSHSCGLLPNHGVLAVGYGSENGKAYWKLKNSWGPWWGELGYFRIARTGGKIGHCWILGLPSYPVVTNKPSPPSPPGPGPVAFKGEPIRYSQNKDKCIDLVDGNLTNGNKLQIWDCNGSPSQNWYFESGIEGGWLKSGLDNSKCVDFGDVQEGTEIRIWDCQANKRQDMTRVSIVSWPFSFKLLGYQYQQSMDPLHRQPLRCMSLPNGDVTNGNIVTASGCGNQNFASKMPDETKWALPSSSLQQSGTQGTVVV